MKLEYLGAQLKYFWDRVLVNWPGFSDDTKRWMRLPPNHFESVLKPASPDPSHATSNFLGGLDQATLDYRTLVFEHGDLRVMDYYANVPSGVIAPICLPTREQIEAERKGKETDLIVRPLMWAINANVSGFRDRALDLVVAPNSRPMIVVTDNQSTREAVAESVVSGVRGQVGAIVEGVNEDQWGICAATWGLTASESAGANVFRVGPTHIEELVGWAENLARVSSQRQSSSAWSGEEGWHQIILINGIEKAFNQLGDSAGELWRALNTIAHDCSKGGWGVTPVVTMSIDQLRAISQDENLLQWDIWIEGGNAGNLPQGMVEKWGAEERAWVVGS